MNAIYRIYQRNNRGGFFYLQHNETGQQESLKTTDRRQAQKLLSARNQEADASTLNLAVGMAHIKNADPALVKRTWQHVIDDYITHGKETSQKRSARELGSLKFDFIRHKPLVATTKEDLKAVLKRGGAATDNYLRRLHNLALKNGWIHVNILAPNEWRKRTKKPKRGITFLEQARIIAAEQNEERRHYYEMLWHTGAAQTDGSLLTAEHLDWNKRVLTYQRLKTGEWCHLSIGSSLEKLLQKLPAQGLLFPNIARTNDKTRSAEFYRRKKILRIEGISLHSYRYAWAERAYAQGYPERFAQAALGHKSRAVHHGYARAAEVICPALDEKPPAKGYTGSGAALLPPTYPSIGLLEFPTLNVVQIDSPNQP